jgi:hypothetical protein
MNKRADAVGIAFFLPRIEPLVCSSCAAQSEPFYKGKTIKIRKSLNG